MTNVRAVFLDDHLSFGGTTTFLCKLLPALRAFGIDATVVASDALAEMEADVRRAGVPLQLYPFRRGAVLYDDVLLPAYRLVAELRPHVVVANHETVSFDLLRYAPPGVLRIGVVHTDDDWSYGLVSSYATQLDAVVCVAGALAERATRAASAGHARTVILPNGVAVPGHLPPITSAPPGELRLLYVGRLVERQKRVRRFVPLWGELRKSPRPILWTIVGDGPEADYLRANMASDGRHRVVFAGAVPQDGVQAHYAASHAILLLSDYEGMPLTLLEGMSQGLVPVVTAQRSGVADLVDARCGIAVPPDEPEVAARAILALQPGQASFGSLREASWSKILSSYSLRGMASQWAQLLHSQPPAGEPVWPTVTRILGPPARPAIAPRWYYAPRLRPARRLASRFLGG